MTTCGRTHTLSAAEVAAMQPQVKRRYVVGLDLVAQQRHTGTAGAPVWETDYYGYDGHEKVSVKNGGQLAVSQFAGARLCAKRHPQPDPPGCG